MVKLQFLGATRQVTGSRYFLEAAGRKILIDCGMFQEREFLDRNWERCPVPPREIDAMLLTHVHIDHSGLIPRLARDGFSGRIYCTRASVALAELLLRDAAQIQMEDAAYKKRRHAKEGRRGKHPEVALFTDRDVERCLPRFRGVSYGERLQLGDAVSVTFFDAGHILGSAMLEILVCDRDPPLRLLFSGDVGQWNRPLVRDPTVFRAADYVVLESTYGDRLHEDHGDVETRLCEVIQTTLRRGGNVVIPTFAVERAQELIYHLGRLVRDGRLPEVTVFLDSPMAADVTDAFRQFQDYLDAETLQLINANRPPLRFPGLRLVRSAEESKAINQIREPCVIMAGSGMCTAGRIKFHLRYNIERPESTILFVGYQGAGTLGRLILERRQSVRIHGRMHRVLAHVAQIHGFSGHADRAGLLRWLGHLERPARQVFLTHGEEQSAHSLAEAIRSQLNGNVTVPRYQDIVEL